MNTPLRRTLVTGASSVLLISGFAAAASAHEGGGHHDAFPHLQTGLVHGEGVIKKSNGSFQSVSEQRGKASNLSSTSLTVTSGDGFARTYALTSATKGDDSRIKAGTTVVVIAAKSGSTWKATFVEVPKH